MHMLPRGSLELSGNPLTPTSRRGTILGMSTPAGWHQDPADPSLMRYWDGSKWTDQTAQTDQASPPPPQRIVMASDKEGKPIQASLAWLIALFTLGYMLPWAVAATRGKSNAGAVGWVNLLAGWTVIGWIIALVMACGAHQKVGVTA